jgi:two-component system chemotaxis sensor kinase CheA
LVLKRASIYLKLLLLAGVPVLGALVLAGVVARDARREAESAAALGSINDLALLSVQMSGLVHELGLERSALALETGTKAGDRAKLDERFRASDAARRRLDEFLLGRKLAALPERLARDLHAAEQALGAIESTRTKALDGLTFIDSTLDYYTATNRSLISATAALAQLTDDGQLMRAISALVNVLEVKERASQEHAVMNHVFAISQFPAGVYKNLVSLITEEADYIRVLEVNATDAVERRFRAQRSGPDFERSLALRTIALDTLDDNFGVDVHEWDRVQSQKVLGLRGLEVELLDEVEAAAAGKAAEARSSVRLSYGLGAGVVVSSVLLAWLIARGIARSIGSLGAAAQKVQREKDFGVRAEKTSDDELGALTDAFNEMLTGIQQRDAELRQHRENLEQLVEQRTLALQRRNEAMRLVLDNVEQGLATIKPDGSIAPERSRAFNDWFSDVPGSSFSAVLAQQDHNLQEWLQVGWEQVVEACLPLELAVAQMPKQVNVGGRHYALDYKAILERDELNGVLLVVSDVTAKIESDARDAEQREVLGMVERLMRDRAGFIEFFQECDALMTGIVSGASGDLPVVMRALHTIKGNCAIFGVNSVAQAAHEVETRALEAKSLPSPADLEQLDAAWRAVAERLRDLVGDEDEPIVEVAYDELDELVNAALAYAPHAQIAALLQRLKFERAVVRLRRVADQATALGQRLGKAPIQVEVQAGSEVRFPTERWAAFWSNFIHVVRNAVDHGIEPRQERVASGKQESGKLSLSAALHEQALIIEIRDDGRGIAWERIRDKARSLGLPVATQKDLNTAIYADGVSTAESVSDISGRGVGMAAMRDATQALGGTITIESTPRQGTTFRFQFPATAITREAENQPSWGAPQLEPDPRRLTLT